MKNTIIINLAYVTIFSIISISCLKLNSKLDAKTQKNARASLLSILVFEPTYNKDNGFIDVEYRLYLYDDGTCTESKKTCSPPPNRSKIHWRIVTDTFYMSNDAKIYYPALYLRNEFVAEILLDSAFCLTYPSKESLTSDKYYYQHIRFGFTHKRYGYTVSNWKKNGIVSMYPAIYLQKNAQDYGIHTVYHKFEVQDANKILHDGYYLNGVPIDVEIKNIDTALDKSGFYSISKFVHTYKRRIRNRDGSYTILPDSVVSWEK